jgi:diacylglycerol O-acyltransferase/trehalose O-mycolyltransferase
MRHPSRPLWPILAATLLLATACGSATQPTVTPQVVLTLPPAATTPSAPAATPASSGDTGPSTAVPPTAPPATDEPTTEPTEVAPTEVAPTEVAPTEVPTDVPPTDVPTDPPATSSGPSSPLPSLASGVRVVNVETVDERTRNLTIETPSLAAPVGVRLLLPAGFETEPTRRWPVLYLLHGAGGGEDSFMAWSYGTDVQALVAPTNLLVVMPQGDGFGWYSDWWNQGNGGPPMWETFHLTELMAILERDWRASDQRAVAGLSMGGYGAMAYAARRPGVFKAAASFSGPLDIIGEKDSGLLGNDPATWGDPVEQLDIWKAHNPIDLAEALRGTALYVSYGEGGQGPLDPGPVGDDGEAFRAIGNQAFVKRMAELQIPVTVDAYGPGTHTWPYFERALHRSLPLLLKALGEGG